MGAIIRFRTAGCKQITPMAKEILAWFKAG
jgi:hypothetical protein